MDTPLSRYADRTTGRSSSSAVVYHEWLVVAGGWRGERRVSSVDVMNTDTNQWFAGPPTPTPWMGMKTVIVRDTQWRGTRSGSGTGPADPASAGPIFS